MKYDIFRYNDVWLDNGLITLFGILNEFDDEEELVNVELNPIKLTFEFLNSTKFKKALSQQIRSNIPNLIIDTEDKKTMERKEVRKDFILIQEGKKIGGKVALKETIYDSSKTESVIDEIFMNLNGEKNNCMICGRAFEKRYKNLQQASYPFVTKIKSLSGIRSGESHKLVEYIKEYCPLCYLCGILEWTDPSLIYRTIPGSKAFLILPNQNDLKKLRHQKRSYFKLLNNNSRYSNIRIDLDSDKTDNTPDKYSTFLSFYENFLRFVNPDFGCQDWFIIEIPLSGSVKNPKYFNLLLENYLIKTMQSLLNKGYYFYRGFVNKFYFFKKTSKGSSRDFDFEKIIHENLCRAFVEDNFNLFTHQFLPKSGGNVGMTKDANEILNQFIYEWRIKPMNVLTEEDIKTLQIAGQTIATLASNHVSLFYKLEKAKNPHDFFKAIQEISRRFVIEDQKEKVYPSSLSKVVDMVIKNQKNQRNFEDIKNILLIYASIRSSKSKPTKENNNE